MSDGHGAVGRAGRATGKSRRLGQRDAGQAVDEEPRARRATSKEARAERGRAGRVAGQATVKWGAYLTILNYFFV